MAQRYNQDPASEDEDIQKARELVSRAGETRIGRFIGRILNMYKDTYGDMYQDDSRDRLFAHLYRLGINASLAERGLPEEKLGEEESPIQDASLGLIHIENSSIRSINMRKEYGGEPFRFRRRRSPRRKRFGKSYNDRAVYLLHYIVPAPRINTDSRWIRIKTVKHKHPPVVGPVSEVSWEGDDLGLGIIEQLNKDQTMCRTLIESGNVLIRPNPEYQCWVMTTEQMYEPAFPSGMEWDTYETIARHLLAEWPGKPDGTD